MTVDDVAPMGSVVVGPATSRDCGIDVTGLPTGGGVQVIRGDVDYAGTATPTPNATVVATKSAADLSSSNRMALDTTDECFYRLQVVDGAGAVVGFGQPIWLLHGEPTTGVPDNRRVTT